MGSKQHKILAIDDNNDNLMILKTLIKEFFPGVITLTALNGKRGLELAAAEDPDAILLDIVMPDMDGFEVCKILKADSKTRDIPVIFITALKDDKEIRIRALNVGAEAFLAKPIDESELTAQIRAMIKIKTANTKNRDEKERLAAMVKEQNQELQKNYQATLGILEELKKENAARKLSEKALRESETRFRLALENSSIVVFNQDKELRYTWIYNPNTAFDVAKTLGKTDAELLPKNDAAHLTEIKMRVLQTGVKAREEVKTTIDGQSFFYDLIVEPLRDADQAIIGVTCASIDITERKKADQALLDSENRLRLAFVEAPFPIMIHAEDGEVLLINKVWTELTGYTLEDIPTVSDWTAKAYGQNSSAAQKYLHSLNDNTGRVDEGEYAVATNSCETRIWDFSSAYIGNDVDDRRLMIRIAKDLTENKKIEAQFRQAQKMETVARLAGGVAHDFNNMLGIIIGYSGMVKEKFSPSDPLFHDMEQILVAARKSADLTRQLLAFSRQEAIAPRSLNINETIGNCKKMLGRLIGEDINLTFIPGDDLWKVNLDPSQFDQILANLCVNARDAIAGVGSITIETQNCVVDEAFCKLHDGSGSSPGEYVVISCSDSGTGMDEKTMENIFEPFFTTKKEGEGTGLGLSTIYGIVRQNHGMVTVSSKIGHGTTFFIYLPRYHEVTTPDVPVTAKTPPGGSEAILVVDDEELLRELGERVLRKQGYNVLSATNPREAIALAEKFQDDIHLLVTDIVMPIMNGKQLHEEIKQIHPEIKVLFMSGYMSDKVISQGLQVEQINFIQKPFDNNVFAAQVRQVLDGD